MTTDCPSFDALETQPDHLRDCPACRALWALRDSQRPDPQACEELAPLLSLFHDVRLDAGDAALVEAHLESCPACLHVLVQESQTSAANEATWSSPAAADDELSNRRSRRSVAAVGVAALAAAAAALWLWMPREQANDARRAELERTAERTSDKPPVPEVVFPDTTPGASRPVQELPKQDALKSDLRELTPAIQTCANVAAEPDPFPLAFTLRRDGDAIQVEIDSDNAEFSACVERLIRRTEILRPKGNYVLRYVILAEGLALETRSALHETTAQDSDNDALDRAADYGAEQTVYADELAADESAGTSRPSPTETSGEDILTRLRSLWPTFHECVGAAGEQEPFTFTFTKDGAVPGVEFESYNPMLLACVERAVHAEFLGNHGKAKVPYSTYTRDGFKFRVEVGGKPRPERAPR